MTTSSNSRESCGDCHIRDQAGSNPGNPYIRLDWTCGGCHSDTVEGTDASNPDFYTWTIDAITNNGGVHGGF